MAKVLYVEGWEVNLGTDKNKKINTTRKLYMRE